MTVPTWSGWTAALVLGAIACGDSAEPPVIEPPPPAPPQLQKIKNLLTGVEVTDDEAQAVADDPAALRGLVDQWIATPAFRGKLAGFFRQAFQQTQINFLQLQEQIAGMTPGLPEQVKARLVASVESSMSLTALQLIDEGRPFTDVVTTERFMLNPPLMLLLAYIDAVIIDDQGVGSSWLPQKFGAQFKLTLHRDDTLQIPLEESVDPASPNFLHFVEPCPVENGTPSCGVTVLANPARVPQAILVQLLGKQFTDTDWTDWRMIRIRPPADGEDPAIFWALPRFRSRAPEHQELALRTPRVGFLTTPAFLANWPTNLSNLGRVTVNQALIVGLGYSLADSSAIIPVSETGNPDGQHSQPGTTCFACHQTLDPMRNFIRQSYSVSYHLQTLPLPPEQQAAAFVLDDVVAPGAGVRDFARAIAQHPRFAGAWARKLCQFAGAPSCSEAEPELARIAAGFRDAGHDFHALVRELFTSPLVSPAVAAHEDEAAGAAPVSIARRDHFCAAMQNRLGLPDACDAAAIAPTLVQNLSLGIPGPGYARGATDPLLPRDPDLFFRSSIEGLCGQLAARVVDPAVCAPGQRCLDSSRAADAIAELVRVVMGLPALDERAADMRAILTEHHAAALAAGHTAGAALASTFVLACSSPLSISIGL